MHTSLLSPVAVPRSSGTCTQYSVNCNVPGRRELTIHGARAPECARLKCVSARKEHPHLLLFIRAGAHARQSGHYWSSHICLSRINSAAIGEGEVPLRTSKSNRPSHHRCVRTNEGKEKRAVCCAYAPCQRGRRHAGRIRHQDSRYRSASRRERHASITLALSFGRRGRAENV